MRRFWDCQQIWCVVSGTDFVEHDNHTRYHESLWNLTPADVYFGRGQAILSQRRTTKEKTMKQRRLINQKRAA